MAKQKNAYSQLCDEISAKINSSNQSKGRSSSAVSNSDLTNMITTLMNTPDHHVKVYSYTSKDTSGTGETLSVEKSPSNRYRNALKPMLKQLGLDKDDVEKINDIPFSKEHAQSVMELATTVIHDYVKLGRKFAFPITDTDETRMEIFCQQAPERISVGNRFKKDDAADDTVTITHARTIMKAKNQVPAWLKTTKR